MKTFTKYLLLLALIITMVACATPNRTSYRTVGSVVSAIEFASNAYYDYRNSGHYDPVLDAKIKEAYVKYQALEKVAKDAEKSYLANNLDQNSWLKALNAFSDSAADIIELVKKFVPKDKLKLHK